MPPRLPIPAALRPALAVATLLLAAVTPAHGLDFATVDPGRDAGGRVMITFRLSDPLDDHTEQSLGRGMPVTLLLHAELWRKRTGWFDRVERSVDALVRLRYDAWDRGWRIERPGMPAISVPTVDSLEQALSHPIALSFSGTERLSANAPCFVVLSVTVKPISLEDMQEVDLWLSGEVGGPGGGIFGIPRGLFDMMRNFAGLGDSRARAVSPEFRPGAPTHR